MGKSGCMLLVGVVVAVVLQCAAAKTVHVVGEGLGWVIPQGDTGAYSTWASSKTFLVGDILTFNFNTTRHDVLEVSKASYDACTSTNPIGTSITTGPANITLDSVGNHYYICTFGEHCNNGQKLAITVSDSPGTSPPSGSPTAGGPTPPGSSSSAVFASFFVAFLSVAMGFFL